MDTKVNTTILEQEFEVHNLEKNINGNIYELEITIEDKVYSEMYYNHQPGNVAVDETPTKIKAHELYITGRMLTDDQQLMKFNLGINAKPQMVKINAQLELEQMLKEFEDVFAWTYKNLKGIPPELAQHKIELDTIMPLAHQARYKLNPNYATTVKQDIDKLLAVGSIEYVEEATWL